MTASVVDPPGGEVAAAQDTIATGRLLPGAPVRVEIDGLRPVSAPGFIRPDAAAPALATRRIAAVVPCYNRRADAEALLADLARLEPVYAGGAIALRILLVDNASEVPLSSLPTPPGLHLEHLRLRSNTGGSGGYNAGMRRVLALDDENDEAAPWRAWEADYVWLVDSDARVAPDTLRRLLDVLEGDGSIVAAGSAICDPITGQAFELGGHVNRNNGDFEPMVPGHAGVKEPVDADYVAACCALVRSQAIRDTGVFPDRFLNGDDVEWFIRMKSMTGGRVVGVPSSLAMHPRFDRFPTWPRYYMTRNAFGPLDAIGATPRLRFRRALREVPRAVQQQMMGRPDLARLHTAGLRHAAEHRTIGPAPDGLISLDAPRPLSTLAQTLIAELGMGRPRPTRGRVLARLMVSDAERALISDQLTRAGVVLRRGQDGARPEGFIKSAVGAGKRLVLGPTVDVAVVPARGRPDSWFLGRLVVAVTPQGFIIRRPRRFATAARAGATLIAGLNHARRIAARADDPSAALRPSLTSGDPRCTAAARRTGLSVTAVILSYNRWPALERTLRALRDSGLFRLDQQTSNAPWSVVVADNASTDRSAELAAEAFPEATVLAIDSNRGVAAFNQAVERTASDLVLILDDDAVPDQRALRRAVELLARRPDLGAVTFHPRHPQTGASEWSFARRFEGSTADRWPVMGCGNLVRRDDWLAAGGYEPAFFLYRNDTDLALKLLAMGRGVHFNPAWTVWHDTAAGAGASKSVNWHFTATRNWVWLTRRHGSGLDRIAGILAGWLWAHRLAGASVARHRATLRGLVAGIGQPAPTLDQRTKCAEGFGNLLHLLAVVR